MADWTGRKVGRVQIKDLIARGGMAEIYLGEHESFGQVAVKVMRGLLERDVAQLARFQREAEVIGELKHTNIVQLFDYIVEDETPCLVMEYIPGPSLASYMKVIHDRRQRIPIAVVAQILRQVAGALDFAHSNGMIHRDIKPANVLLRSPSQLITTENILPLDVEPVLTDFGLVRLVDSTLHTTTGSVSGTPTYMSPEQSRGEKVDHRTDIYSLGIMLYEMLAGVVPFQADTTFGMLMKHINEPPPTIKGLSADMNALLDRALAKDPSMRYESAGELANEFMALFNGQTISPGTLHIAELARKAAEASNTRPQPTPQPPSRFRWVRLGFEVVLALGLAYVIYAFVGPAGINNETTSVDPNVPAGRMRFADFSGVTPMDQVLLSLNNVEPPEQGKHFEGWLVANDGSTFRKIGRLALNDAGVWQVTLTDPDQQNFLQNYDQVIVTLESDGSEITQPTGEVVYSSIFPAQSLIPIRNLLVRYENVPLKDALIQGLWYYSGSYISKPISGDKENSITGLREALENGDEDTFRLRLEEIINQIVGDQSDQFQDYNKDVKIDNTPGEIATDGYGAFPNGTSNGYIQETAHEAKLAADAVDSTLNIRTNSEKLQICIQNMDARLQSILESALRLNDMPFGAEMEPIITDLEALADGLINGNDADNNGLIDATPGECGANDAYTIAYALADMYLYPGEERIPPTGK
ncbi:MAG TPA: serine/threonine-protein kinase [Anaerolineales bacterium]|nr:serine/threonine-protein kinase [Anaerolineales bacterium]